MFRYLQTTELQPVAIVIADEDMERGTPCDMDFATGKIKKCASGIPSYFVDVANKYEGMHAILQPASTEFEDVKDGDCVIGVPAKEGGRYATTELTVGTLEKGDPIVCSSGKFVKASGSTPYGYIYGGVYADPTGLMMHVVERVKTSTAPATYTVTYDANTGTGTTTDANSPYYSGRTAIVLDSTFVPPTGKVFLKWNTAAAGGGTDYDPGDSIAMSASVTLYATWTDAE